MFSRVRNLKSWQIIVVFALAGLLVAGASFAYAAFYPYDKPTNGFDILGGASLILCPPQLIFAGCIDCEVVGRNGFIMYSIIGLLNGALYALVGMMVSAIRNKPNLGDGR